MRLALIVMASWPRILTIADCLIRIRTHQGYSVPSTLEIGTMGLALLASGLISLCAAKKKQTRCKAMSNAPARRQ